MRTKVSVFTPTANRPRALALCQKYVARAATSLQRGHICEHIIERGGTLAENIISGMSRVTGDVVVIFEDDDYYSKGWVQWCVEALENCVAAGDSHTHYYHLTSGRYRVTKHPNRSSLACTAFKRSQIPLLIEACSRDQGIDLRFWRALRQRQRATTLRSNRCPMVVGMKGYHHANETPGMGAGHRDAYYPKGQNNSREKQTRILLRQLVGEEAASIFTGLIN